MSEATPRRSRASALGAGLLVAITVAFAVLLTVVLAAARFERALFDVAASRLEAIGDEVARKTEFGLTFGLDLRQLTDLDAAAAIAARQPGVASADILDAAGAVAFSGDPGRVGRPGDASACAARRADMLAACLAVQDSLGRAAGQIIVQGSTEALRLRLSQLQSALVPRLLVLVGAAFLLALVVTIHVIRRSGDAPRNTALRLTIVAAALLIVASGLAARDLFLRFNPLFETELSGKADVVADRLSRQIDRALAAGIPLDRLEGVTDLFAHEVRRWPDIAYAALRDAEGRTLAAAGLPAKAGDRPSVTPDADGQGRAYAGFAEIARPLSSGARTASLHVGIDEAQLARETTNLALEFLAVGVVSILLTFEVLFVAATLAARKRDAAPAGGKRFELAYLRLPIFLFCMAEELSRPSLPAYAKSFGPSAPFLSPDLVVSLPITLFMLVWGFSQPKGARWSERWGRGRTMAIGSALAVTGLALTAFSGTLVQLMLWRAVTALGYGMFLISAQGMIVDNTDAQTRARGLSTFIGALLGAGVCGPLVGGVIADHAGVPASFITGAVIAAAAGIAVMLWAAPASAKPRPSVAPQGKGVLPSLLTNGRFMALMTLSAAPAKIAATSILFFLTPLLMKAEGASNAEIGRVQMLYYLAFILFSPIAARLSDRWGARGVFVIMGGLGTFASFVGAAAGDVLIALPVCVALFGFFQSLVGAPQLTLVSEIARSASLPETVVIGWYRLIERLGGAAGPLVAGLIAASFSYRGALVGIGLICGAATLLYIVGFVVVRRRADQAEGATP